MANTIINTPELLNLDSTTGATILAKGTVSERPPTPDFGVDYLVVAGGGSGGSNSNSGGGGAGGYRTNYGGTPLSLNVATNYNVTVGAGAAATTSSPWNGTVGSNSDFNNISATGGGGGSGQGGSSSSGGSGGGGAYDTGGTSGNAGNYTPFEGYAGGAGQASGSYPGGGGGGASEAGNTDGVGHGGDGASNSITGSAVVYAGGGSGGVSAGYSIIPGGDGGGGAGSNGGAVGTSGTANTGGGAGGGAGSYGGGAGGSGVVILRYPSNITVTVGSGLTTSVVNATVSGSTDKYTTFTAGTGTVSFLKTAVSENDATDGTLRFNTDTNKTEYFDGTGWYEIVDEYASGFVGPATNYFDTKLYTGNGATQSIGGYINGAGSFNGSSSKIDLDSSISSTFTDNFTFSAWVYPTNNSLYNCVFANGFGMEIYFYQGRFAVWSNDANSGTGRNIVDFRTSTTNYALNQWYHFVFVFTKTSQAYYINGQPDGTNTTSSYTPYSGVPTLGYFNPTSAYYWHGLIDQVRIYNVALSSSDVAALNLETAATASTAAFPSGQTAIATYTMDTSANGLLTTTDLSTVDYPSGAGCVALYEMNGNSNDTSNTYNGTPTNISYQGGAFDQAAVFGSSSNILLPSNLISGTTDSDYSVSLWVKFDTLPGANFAPLIGQLSNTSAFRILLYHNSGSTYNVGLLRTFGGTYYYNSPNTAIQGTFNVGQYYNVIVTYQSSNKLVNGYLNGNSIGSYTLNASGSGAAGAPALGTYNGTTSYSFDGSMDQVRIFNTVLTQSQVTTLARGIATSYSGASTDVNFNGHLDFQPDFVWIKNRDQSDNHLLFDAVRGAGNYLMSSSTAIQYFNNTTLKSFDNNGFSLGSDSTGGAANGAGEDLVAWNWKAGGAAVTNNDGTIAAQVSANKDSGFSIVKYTGNNTDGATVGTGLTQACNIVIVKDLTSANYWCVGGSTVGDGETLYLNDTSAKLTRDRVKSVQTNTFTLGNHFETNSTNNFIAYCWHSVTGYSSIGSYTGASSSTVPVTTNFRPSIVIIKNIDTSSTRWVMYYKTGDSNSYYNYLFADDTLVEQGSTSSTIKLAISNTGFTVPVVSSTWVNNTGDNYLYMAFA